MNPDVEWIFAVGVLVLRAGLIAAGVVFCGYGFRLFARTRPPSSAEIAWGQHLRVNLVQVGPGVFFSLFGAALLIHCVGSPLTLQLSEGLGRREVVVAGAVASAAPAPDRAALLRTLQQIALLNRIDPGTGQLAAQDLGDLDRVSRQLRLALMRSTWQPEWGDATAFESWVQDPAGRSSNRLARETFERR